jgi:hypothetical protein
MYRAYSLKSSSEPDVWSPEVGEWLTTSSPNTPFLERGSLSSAIESEIFDIAINTDGLASNVTRARRAQEECHSRYVIYGDHPA